MMYETVKTEKALLVMVEAGREKFYRQTLAEEFRNLVLSAGIEVVDCVFVRKDTPTPSFYIGKGKVEELAIIVQEEDIDVVIFNNNLNFTQQRNLEEVLGVKTIDRTQLILDIFSQHAQTQEGRLQVELAQLEYLLPRLKGKGIMLSRQAGGIGTRGPGEKKLEVDRRRISDRITRLKKDLAEVKKHRETMRKKRQKKKMSVCSLVGYTNAGKSTLFNSLTQSEERTSPSLFTTLDTVSRTISLHNNFKVLITDTVGFLYKLPPNLIEAFKATLEELHFADVLLHIVDASNTEIKRLMDSVNTILKELHLEDKPTVLVFNKIDRLVLQDLDNLKKIYPEAVFISALKRTNLDILKEKIYKVLFKEMVEALLKIPFNLMETVDYLYKNCEVIKINYQESSVVYWVRIKKDKLPYLEKKGIKIEVFT
jgi:GTP-binding protein HflX